MQDPERLTQRTLVGGDFKIAKSFCGAVEKKTTINLRQVSCLNCLNRMRYLESVARASRAKADAPKPMLFDEPIEEVVSDELQSHSS